MPNFLPTVSILLFALAFAAAPPAAVGVDFIVASCYDPGDGATPGIGWGVFEQGNPVGTRAWTSRGRF